MDRGPHTVVLHDGAACLLHSTLLGASFLPTLAKQVLGSLVEVDSLVLLRWSEPLSVGGGRVHHLLLTFILKLLDDSVGRVFIYGHHVVALRVFLVERSLQD